MIGLVVCFRRGQCLVRNWEPAARKKVEDAQAYKWSISRHWYAVIDSMPPMDTRPPTVGGDA